MNFGRLISLVLSAALVACPSVCRIGVCTECSPEPITTAACSHCHAGQNSGSPSSKNSSDSPCRAPLQPNDHCDLGNCLCAGAVTNGGVLDLQIGHVLGLFGAFESVGDRHEPSVLCDVESLPSVDHDDLRASGRRLRLRIESLLI
jgi:hypothetical protein